MPKVDSAVQIEQGDRLNKEREQFASEVQRELDELAAKVGELRKKALSATGKAKEKIDQHILVLEQEQKELEGQLAAMKLAIGDKWKEFKADISAAISKFRESVKNAI